MNIIEKNGFYYLRYSFRKEGKTITKDKYLGKKIPADIEKIKQHFKLACLKGNLYKKLALIKKNYYKEWRSYPDSVKKKVLIDFSVNFTYNSNAIEGSTITLDETEDLIKHKISPHKPLQDVQETINHAKIFLQSITEKKLSLRLLLHWHKALFEDTKPDIAGTIREYGVRVGPYKAPNWQDLKQLLKEFFTWCSKNKKMNPVELAARVHYKFEKIHPFGDGNGRVGRIIIAQILKLNNYPFIIIEYKKRKSYYKALQNTEEKFVQYFFRRYLAFNKKYL